MWLLPTNLSMFSQLAELYDTFKWFGVCLHFLHCQWYLFKTVFKYFPWTGLYYFSWYLLVITNGSIGKEKAPKPFLVTWPYQLQLISDSLLTGYLWFTCFARHWGSSNLAKLSDRTFSLLVTWFPLKSHFAPPGDSLFRSMWLQKMRVR